MKANVIRLLVPCLLMVSLLACGRGTSYPTSAQPQQPPSVSPTQAVTEPSRPILNAGWVQVQGTGLIQENGTPFTIASMIMATEDVSDGKSLPLDGMYDDIAYLGFNTVTLDLTYTLLQPEELGGQLSEEGFSCLDLHIEKAAQRGLHVIVHMDTPPGGFQSWGQGGALWSDPQYQAQLVDLWSAIAARYADQSAVLGYSLLSEPCPLAESPREALSAWQALAEKIVTAVRKQDSRHLLFVDSLYRYVDSSGTMLDPGIAELPNGGFPVLDDSGVVLQTNVYYPHFFTSQPESDPLDTPYLVYPSDFIIGLEEQDDTQLYSQGNENLDIFNPQWQTLRSELVTVTDTRTQYVQPCISLWQLGSYGSVWADEMYLDEFDDQGNFLGSLLYLSFNSQTDFAHYAQTGSTTWLADCGCLQVSGVEEGGYAIAEAARVPVTQGHAYQLRVNLRAEGLPETASVAPMLCFTSGSGPLKMNRDSLLQDLRYRMEGAMTLNQPLYIGAFGSNLASFSHGATEWVSDVLSICRENQLGFGYFLYRNDYYGLYQFDGGCNSDLYHLFADKLRS